MEVSPNSRQLHLLNIDSINKTRTYCYHENKSKYEEGFNVGFEMLDYLPYVTLCFLQGFHFKIKRTFHSYFFYSVTIPSLMSFRQINLSHVRSLNISKK